MVRDTYTAKDEDLAGHDRGGVSHSGFGDVTLSRDGGVGAGREVNDMHRIVNWLAGFDLAGWRSALENCNEYGVERRTRRRCKLSG